MKPNKGHVGVIDAMIQEVGGPKKSGWFARTFCTLESYNRRVIRKFSGLTDEQKDGLDRMRKKLERRTARAKQVAATARSRARRGK